MIHFLFALLCIALTHITLSKLTCGHPLFNLVPRNYYTNSSSQDVSKDDPDIVFVIPEAQNKPILIDFPKNKKLDNKNQVLNTQKYNINQVINTQKYNINLYITKSPIIEATSMKSYSSARPALTSWLSTKPAEIVKNGYQTTYKKGEYEESKEEQVPYQYDGYDDEDEDEDEYEENNKEYEEYVTNKYMHEDVTHETSVVQYTYLPLLSNLTFIHGLVNLQQAKVALDKGTPRLTYEIKVQTTGPLDKEDLQNENQQLNINQALQEFTQTEVYQSKPERNAPSTFLVNTSEATTTVSTTLDYKLLYLNQLQGSKFLTNKSPEEITSTTLAIATIPNEKEENEEEENQENGTSNFSQYLLLLLLSLLMIILITQCIVIRLLNIKRAQKEGHFTEDEKEKVDYNEDFINLNEALEKSQVLKSDQSPHSSTASLASTDEKTSLIKREKKNGKMVAAEVEPKHYEVREEPVRLVKSLNGQKMQVKKCKIKKQTSLDKLEKRSKEEVGAQGDTLDQTSLKQKSLGSVSKGSNESITFRVSLGLSNDQPTTPKSVK